MKPFLLALILILSFEGTIFASAQIKRMTAKMSEKIMWSIYVSRGRLTKFELKNPSWDLKENMQTLQTNNRKRFESFVYF